MSEKIETGGPAFPHTLRGHPIETGMSEKFTSEPWVVGNADGLLFGKKQGNGTEPIGFVFGPSLPERSEVGMRAIANARRIVACVNALEHISTEDLESGRMQNLGVRLANAEKQRDELIRAIECAFREGFSASSTYNDILVNDVNEEWEKSEARAAILKATGEKS